MNLPYSTSKAVMNMVTVQLASRLKKNNVTVVCFHPGWVRTDMGGSGADLSSSQAAQAIQHNYRCHNPRTIWIIFEMGWFDSPLVEDRRSMCPRAHN